MRHGYIRLGRDISLLIFDEAHHAVENDPYNRIMTEFYWKHSPTDTTYLPSAINPEIQVLSIRPMILGLTASPIFGGTDIEKAFRYDFIISELYVLTRFAARSKLIWIAKFVHLDLPEMNLPNMYTALQFVSVPISRMSFSRPIWPSWSTSFLA
jgi:hypothetical protein